MSGGFSGLANLLALRVGFRVRRQYARTGGPVVLTIRPGPHHVGVVSGGFLAVPSTYRTLTGDWRADAQQAYREFLAPFTFQWFATFTFASAVHPEAADKAWRVWVNKLNIDLYGKRWRNRPPEGVMVVRALEWQKRGVLHYHALVAGIPVGGPEQLIQLAMAYQRVWLDDMGCGFARIDIVRNSQDAVHAYVAKYVTKGGELDFSRNFSIATQQQLPENDLVSRGLARA